MSGCVSRRECVGVCVLVSSPSSSSLVRRYQVSAVLSAITALNSSSRLCVECVHVCMSAFLDAELSQLHHREDNAAALEATPQCLDDFQMDFVKLEGSCGENIYFG